MSAIMQALAAVPSPQNRIKVVRPNNDYTARGTTVTIRLANNCPFRFHTPYES